ncbi:C2 domain-containing protein 3 [Xenopus laevis]|uniref:C2 domain-containing protein 3 n=2 Tax=Xenopus laevis TaxID=8355 RepID=A0A1L8HB94_XENLA|nr:C2 domain-containing protein 3 [Xenopus laevis]OCT93380.1 hypothetical protein XELAEV_18016448mg [Xenopus laevis]
MKSRRVKSARPGKGRSKGVTDVSPSSSLPPLVEGQVRSFLQVTVSKILWTVPKPPLSVLVRLRWWGETSNGTIFRPRDSSQTEQKGLKTTTRYAVRCGPKQFTSYLTDMGMLVFEVMTKLDHFPIGRAQISGIAQLSLAHPISGFFTIVSPTSEKLGELQVSVQLEPLSETYDSSSSAHNTDISFDHAASRSESYGKALTSHPTALNDPPQPIRLSSADRRESESSSSRVTTPRGRDHLYFQENVDPGQNSYKGSQEHVNREQGNMGVHSSKQICSEGTAGKDASTVTSGPATKDLLSALLDQGSKLRDAMVVSALKSSPDLVRDPAIMLPPALINYSLSQARAASEVQSSTLMQNLLNRRQFPHSRDILLQAEDSFIADTETPSDAKAIELLLGSSVLSPGRYWDGTGSPPESMSGSDFYNESELNDPLYDQSLLENLFYKAPSDSSDLMSDDENAKSQNKKIKTARDRGFPQDQSADKEDAKQTKGKNSLRDSRTSEKSLTSASKFEGMSLSMDQVRLLDEIHVAHVVVESLRIPLDTAPVTPSKTSSRGRPPRPVHPAKQTFFVEFQFPASSKSRSGEVSSATEITRLVSSKIVGGSVKFQQRFAFPVMFSGQMIKQWWNTDLSFRIFLRKGTQKKPGPVGSASLPLRDVLQSPGLSLTCILPVSCTIEDHHTAVGPLKVSVELAGNNKNVLNLPEKTLEPQNQAPVSLAISSKARTELENSASYTDLRPVAEKTSSLQQSVPLHTGNEGLKVSVPQDLQQTTEEDGLLLHVVLMVPEGKGLITAGSDCSGICNSYLNCKLFSSQEATRSSVVWGSSQPQYNFSQVAPVTLTGRLLERMKNNVMIIEIWNRVASPGQDQLLGLVKLPLHQFYMSFSNAKITRLLLQAQYPVVAVDSYVPIIDMFSGRDRGKLKVLLAMGSGDQVVTLQRLKNEEGTNQTAMLRPAHFLDPPLSSSQIGKPQEGVTDHIFEIHVENVKGLTPLQSTVWGEADCFVQYYFPEHGPDSHAVSELPEIAMTLKPIRTATTLCVPDPVFNDRQSHTIAAQSDTPVQRLLLSAYSMQGLSGGGGVPFEIWCRYYYPNVRDQMVAKGLLPLSRLCAMVTMQHREDVGIQAFSLPLVPRTEKSAEFPPHCSGLLNVNMTYRRSVRNPVGMLATRMVSISVQIHRASGLQAAAQLVAQQDASFQYSADVGVNAYATIHPAFLPDVEVRNTRTVARTFCPQFDHHSEFPCNMVIQRSNGEACSLAEVLYFSEIVLSIHHQNVASVGSRRPQAVRDYHLGMVRIPCKELITKRSGVSGWYPVTVPEDSRLPSSSTILHSVVGGLELSIHFAHHSDRDRVLEVARGLGWNEYNDDFHEAIVTEADEWHKREDLVNLSVSIPKIWLPLHCLLLAAHKHLHKSTYCYLRYKFYDKEAVCSPLRRPRISEDGQQATVMFDLSENVELIKHQPLVWYLREERMEIQVWRSYGKDTSGPRPQDTDRLIGSAYVDLKVLSENTSRTLTVSGVYPVFKRNVSSLWGAAVRVHLALRSAYHPSNSTRRLSYAEEGSQSEEEEAGPIPPDRYEEKPDGLSKKDKPEAKTETPLLDTKEQPMDDVDLENTFAANIVVERAMHLSLKGTPLTERTEGTPSCCVSFPVAGTSEPISTPVIANTDAPLWNFQHQARLHKELLLDPQQRLVFKVWHKTDVERVLGFASVDLSPLLSGFQTICGWYNIVDFVGQCQGQVKVSITPLQGVAHHKEKVTSQQSSLYQSRPAFCSSISYNYSQLEGLANIPHRDNSGPLFPFLRHEEHMENVRRFHESLQQAEKNTHTAEGLDFLSQSSRSSLLSALRKNLSELDDIQKYFNQKLYRSISNTDTARCASVQSQEVQPLNSEPAEEDSDAKMLLKKSNLLVSQVSNLITGLQSIPKFAPAFSHTEQRLDTQGQSSFQQQQDNNMEPTGPVRTNEREGQHSDTPPFSPLGSLTVSGEKLFEFMGTDIDEKEGHLFAENHHEQGDEQIIQGSSDEEYEEDVIEPRTLNEITNMTDRTSPWSSILSERDSDAVDHPQEQPVNPLAVENNCVVTDFFSSFHQNDLSSIPSTARSSDSQALAEGSRLRKISSSSGSDAESIEFNHGRDPGEQEGDLDEADSEAESQEKEEDPGDDKREEEQQDPITVSSDTDESEHVTYDASQSEHSPPQDEPETDYRSSEPLDRNQCHFDENLDDQPDVSEKPPVPSSNVLSDPVIVPNFFLPPQHLEASMRLLSLSAASEKARDYTPGIPFRRSKRQKPKLTPADLPKEETNRIARIFAAQFPSAEQKSRSNSPSS